MLSCHSMPCPHGLPMDLCPAGGHRPRGDILSARQHRPAHRGASCGCAAGPASRLPASQGVRNENVHVAPVLPRTLLAQLQPALRGARWMLHDAPPPPRRAPCTAGAARRWPPPLMRAAAATQTFWLYGMQCKTPTRPSLRPTFGALPTSLRWRAACQTPPAPDDCVLEASHH